MSLHISEKTRKKRKNQINKIKKETDFIIEKYEEKIYRIIKRKENIIKKQSQIYDVMITVQGVQKYAHCINRGESFKRSYHKNDTKKR